MQISFNTITYTSSLNPKGQNNKKFLPTTDYLNSIEKKYQKKLEKEKAKEEDPLNHNHDFSEVSHSIPSKLAGNQQKKQIVEKDIPNEFQTAPSPKLDKTYRSGVMPQKFSNNGSSYFLQQQKKLMNSFPDDSNLKFNLPDDLSLSKSQFENNQQETKWDQQKKNKFFTLCQVMKEQLPPGNKNKQVLVAMICNQAQQEGVQPEDWEAWIKQKLE